MKRYILLVIFIHLFFSGYCQTTSSFFIDFDQPLPQQTQLAIDTNSNIHWQVGTPHKQKLDSAYTWPYAIITDTLNNYLSSDTSVFVIRIITPPLCIGLSGQPVYIEMQTKFDSDTITDYGTIYFSSDSINWVALQGGACFVLNTDLVTNIDSSYLSGRQNNWTEIWASGFIGTPECSFNLALNEATADDTIYFKFAFVTDNNGNNKEGWVIDNIFLNLDCSFGIEGNNEPDTDALLFPNPASEWIQLNIRPEYIGSKFSISNIQGQIIQRGILVAPATVFDVQNYAAGVYIIHWDKEGVSEYRKFVKN